MRFKVFVLFVLFHFCYADTSSYSETNQSTPITNINATNLDGHLQLAALDIVLPIDNSTSSSSNATQLPRYKDSVRSNNETRDANVKVNDTQQKEDTEVASTEDVKLTLMKDSANDGEGVREGELLKKLKEIDLEVNKNTHNIEVRTEDIQKIHSKEKNTTNRLNEGTTMIEMVTSSTTEQTLATYAATGDRPKDLTKPRFRQKFPPQYKLIDQLTRYEEHNRHLTSTESAEPNNEKSEDDHITTEEVTTRKYTRSTISSRYGDRDKSIQRGHESSVTKNNKNDNSTDNERTSTQKYKSNSSLHYHMKPNKVETSTSTSNDMSEISTTSRYHRYISQQRHNKTNHTDSPENNVSSTYSTMSFSTAPMLDRFKMKRKETFSNRGRGYPHIKINGNLNITSSQSNYSSIDEHDKETIPTEVPHSTSSFQQLREKINGETTTAASITKSSLSHQNSMRNSSSNKKLNNSNIYEKSIQVELKNSTNSGILQVPSIQQHLQNTSHILSQKENSTAHTVSSTTNTSLRGKYSRNQNPIHLDPLIHLQNNQLSTIAVIPNSTEVKDKQPKTSTNTTIANEYKHYRSLVRPQLGQQSLNFRKHVYNQEEVSDEENRSKYRLVRPRAKKIEYQSGDSDTTEADAHEEESTTINSSKSRRVYKKPSIDSTFDKVSEEDNSSKYRPVRPRMKKFKYQSEDFDTTEADASEEESTTINSSQSRRVYKKPSIDSTFDKVSEEDNSSKYRPVRPRMKKFKYQSEDFDTTEADASEEESTTINSSQSRRVYKKPSIDYTFDKISEEDNSSKYRPVRPRMEELKYQSEDSDTTEVDAPKEKSTTTNSSKSRRVYRKPSSDSTFDEVPGEDNSSKYRPVRPRVKKIKYQTEDSDTTEDDEPEEESTTTNRSKSRRVYRKPSIDSTFDEVPGEDNSSKYRPVRPRIKKLKYQSENSDTTEADAPEEESTTTNSSKSKRVYIKPSRDSTFDEVPGEDNSSKYRPVRPHVEKLKYQSEDSDTTEDDAPEEESTTINSSKSRRVYMKPSSESISDEIPEEDISSKYRHVRPRVKTLKHESEDFDTTEGDAPDEESTTLNIIKKGRIYKRPSSNSVNSKISVDFAKDFKRKDISDSGKNHRRVHMKPKKDKEITLDMLEEEGSSSDFEESSALNMRKSRENEKRDGSIEVNTGEGKTLFSATDTMKVLQKEGIFNYSSVPADFPLEKADTDHKNAEKEYGEYSTKESSVTGTSDTDLTLMQEYIDKRIADGEAAEQSTVTVDPSYVNTTAEVDAIAANRTDNNFDTTKSVNQTNGAANTTANSKDSTKENSVTIAVQTATAVIKGVDNATKESKNIPPDHYSDTFNQTESIIENMNETHQNNATDVQSSTEIIEDESADDITESNDANRNDDDNVDFNWTTTFTTTESNTTVLEDKSNILILTKDKDKSKDRKTNDSLIVTTILGHPTNVSIRIQTENNINYIPLDVKVSEDISHLMLNFTWPTNENITNTITLNMKKISKQYVIDTVQLYLVNEGNVSIWTKNITQSQVIETTGSLYLELENGVQVMFSNADFLKSAEKRISTEDSSKKKEGTVLYVEIIVGSILIVCLLIICIFAGWKMIQLRRERRDHTTTRH